MSQITTGGRRSIAAAAFIAAVFTVAACGTQTAIDDASTVPGSAPNVQMGPAGTSADAAERRGQQQESSPTSADAAERRGQQDVKPAPAGKRVPD